MTAPDAEFQHATRLYQAGDLARAEAVFQAALRRQPAHAEALYLLGIIALRTGRALQAAERLAQAIALRPNEAEMHNNLGNALGDLGRHAEARSAYDLAIALRPDFAEAHYNLGATMNDLGRAEDAVACFSRAIALKPDLVEAYFNRGVTLAALGRREAALADCDRSLALRPDHAEAHFNRGNLLRDLGQSDAAVTAYDRAIALRRDHAEAHNNRGNALRDLGRPGDALRSYEQAIALKPDFAEAHYNRGNVLRTVRRTEDALLSYDTAIALEPAFAAAYVNRGNALEELGRHHAACASYDRAIALRPDQAEAHYNLGNALGVLGLTREALASYDKAIALRPDHAEAWCYRGNALTVLRRFEEALASCDQAIALRPDHAEAHNYRGNALGRLDRRDEALASYARAIALRPDYADAHYNRGCLLHDEGRTDEAVASHAAAIAADPSHGAARLAFCMHQLPIVYQSEAEIPIRRQQYVAALDDLVSAADASDLMRALAGAIGAVQPFQLPYQGMDDVVPQAVYGRLAARVLAATETPAPSRPRSGARIRLGIVSGFFRYHTIFKLFLEGWLAELDRDRFEVIGFHTGDVSDAMTARAASLCDRFVHDLPSNAEWRRAILDSGPDVLLYPEVGMDPVAGFLSAQRLARTQCVAWGHPETTGLPTMDWFLSSDLMEPPGAEAYYTERLARLPNLGLHYTPDEWSVPPLERADLGIDPAVPVYWSGQSLYKYLPRHDSLFPRIAKAVGDCRFVFIDASTRPAVTARFRVRLGRAFAAFGLEAEQYCVWLPRLPPDRFIAAVGMADVVLDPPEWSGGKSTLDCLSQNPAIVTLPGTFMRGRHAAAILRRIGCEDTIARTEDEYVAIATRLGRDAAWRGQIREVVAAGKLRAFRDRDYPRALEILLTACAAR